MPTATKRIYLIRHGETEFNRMGVFRGRFEVRLERQPRARQAGDRRSASKGSGLEILYAGP